MRGLRCRGGEKEERLSSTRAGIGPGPLPSAESRDNRDSALKDSGESDLSDIFLQSAEMH